LNAIIHHEFKFDCCTVSSHLSALQLLVLNGCGRKNNQVSEKIIKNGFQESFLDEMSEKDKEIAYALQLKSIRSWNNHELS
jgi:hypothetical protein